MGGTGRLQRTDPSLANITESETASHSRKEASEISTTFKEIKDECWSHHASEQFLKVLEEDTNHAGPTKPAWVTGLCRRGWVGGRSLPEQTNRVPQTGYAATQANASFPNPGEKS